MDKLFSRTLVASAVLSSLVLAANDACATLLFTFNDPSGLSAEAEFTVLSPTTLQIRLQNTSTGTPDGFSNSDQILTGLSWDFGEPGFNGDVTITGGSVVIGSGSASVDFDTGSYGPGFDVSGEWGYGNMDGTGALTNFVTANTALATPFGGANLDGPDSIDGPQGGLVANPLLIALGGIGAIQDEVIATLTLSGPITEAQLLIDLVGNGTRVEFGSDAAFIPGTLVPGPGALGLLVSAVVIRRGRRRHS